MLETVISWKTWKTECIIKFKLSLNCNRCLTITSGLNIFCTFVFKYKNQIVELFKIHVFQSRQGPADDLKFGGFDLLDVADLGLILSDLEVVMFSKLGTWWNFKKFSKNFIYISYRNDLNLGIFEKLRKSCDHEILKQITKSKMRKRYDQLN